MLRAFRLLMLIASATMLVSQSADADEYYTFLTVSCAPEIHFFAIRNYGIYNPAEGTLERNADVVTSQQLERRPYNCDFGERARVTVRGLCRSQVVPVEVLCAPGRGPRVEEIAIFVNGQILPLRDQFRTSETINWLSIQNGRRHSVELSVWMAQGVVNVLQCRSYEGATPRYYEFSSEWKKTESDCRSFELPLPASR